MQRRFRFEWLPLLMAGVLAGCAPTGEISERAISDAAETAPIESQPMLQSEQVFEGKRRPHERAVLGLEMLLANGKKTSGCTAVLIRPDVILTAAHCFDPDLVKGVQSYRAQPTTNMNTVVTTDPRSRAIIKYFSHPQYNSRKRVVNGVVVPFYDHDIAVALLESAMDKSIPPQPLASASDSLVAGQRILAYGFGRAVDWNDISLSGPGLRGGTLQRGQMIVSNQPLFDRLTTRSDSKSFLCQGDSGGPAFSIPTTKNAKPVVVSVNSASGGPSMGKGFELFLCKGRSVVQPVASAREWIDAVMREIGR